MGTNQVGVWRFTEPHSCYLPRQRKKDNSSRNSDLTRKACSVTQETPKSMKTAPKNPCLQNSRYSVEAGSWGALSSRDLAFGFRSERAPFTTNDLSSCHHGDNHKEVIILTLSGLASSCGGLLCCCWDPDAVVKLHFPICTALFPRMWLELGLRGSREVGRGRMLLSWPLLVCSPSPRSVKSYSCSLRSVP